MLNTMSIQLALRQGLRSLPGGDDVHEVLMISDSDDVDDRDDGDADADHGDHLTRYRE